MNTKKSMKNTMRCERNKNDERNNGEKKINANLIVELLRNALNEKKRTILNFI